MSMVPRQLSDYDEKLAWLLSQADEFQPDVVITPQEYFGGVTMMPHRIHFSQEELLPVLTKQCRKRKMGLVAGVCEKLPDKNVQSLWFINEGGEFLGSIQKFAHPKYDHVSTNGSGNLTPETEFENRFKTFEIQGLRVAGIFCWEVYSTVLWAGLSLCKPDLIANCIKFGPNAWPKVRSDKFGVNRIVDFGYGTWEEEGGWINRMKFGSLWESRCPVSSSCNSWNLRPISMPICGTYTGIEGQGPNSLWHPVKGEKYEKGVPIEKVIVDEIDRNAVRTIRKNKFAYKDAVGEFPPMSVMRFTMLLKMSRIEDRLLSGSEQKSVESSKQYHKDLEPLGF